MGAGYIRIHVNLHFDISIYVSAEGGDTAKTEIFGVLLIVAVPFGAKTEACTANMKCPFTAGVAVNYSHSVYVRPDYPLVSNRHDSQSESPSTVSVLNYELLSVANHL